MANAGESAKKESTISGAFVLFETSSTQRSSCGPKRPASIAAARLIVPYRVDE